MFLRNEPILFSSSFRLIDFGYKALCHLQRRLQMGSFWRNEPILGGFMVGSVAANTTSRRLVGLGFENEPTGGGI